MHVCVCVNLCAFMCAYLFVAVVFVSVVTDLNPFRSSFHQQSHQVFYLVFPVTCTRISHVGDIFRQAVPFAATQHAADHMGSGPDVSGPLHQL